MISHELMIYCLVCGGIYLALITLLLEWTSSKLKLTATIPEEMREKFGGVWVVMMFAVEFLFFVVITSFLYNFLNLIFPLTPVRTALGGALIAFVLGALPFSMALMMRMKLPLPFLLYQLLSLFLKLGGCLAIIGYLNSL